MFYSVAVLSSPCARQMLPCVPADARFHATKLPCWGQNKRDTFAALLYYKKLFLRTYTAWPTHTLLYKRLLADIVNSVSCIFPHVKTSRNINLIAKIYFTSIILPVQVQDEIYKSKKRLQFNSQFSLRSLTPSSPGASTFSVDNTLKTIGDLMISWQC